VSASFFISLLCDFMKNRYGVDVAYFRKELTKLARDLDNYTPMELARYFETLSDVATEESPIVLQRIKPVQEKRPAKRIELLEYVGKALREYIDAIPQETVADFPAMPGIDRDFVDSILDT